MKQQGLWFQLRSLFEHRHHHALPPRPPMDQIVSANGALVLQLPLGLQLASIVLLRAAHRVSHRINLTLLDQPINPLGHGPPLDLQ
jgi:hypothetical protein